MYWLSRVLKNLQQVDDMQKLRDVLVRELSEYARRTGSEVHVRAEQYDDPSFKIRVLEVRIVKRVRK